MNTVQELREKRAKIWDNAKDFLDSKRTSDVLISEEDSKTYEKMESEVVNLGKEIERLERQAVIDLELSKAVNKPIRESIQTHEKVKTGIASDEYKDAFWKAMRNRNGYEIRDILQIGQDVNGGYLVPDEFERQLVESLEEENIFRKLATIITTSSGDRKIPVVATKGTASWIDEGQEIPESDNTFGQVSIGAFKLATLVKISEELLNDSAFNMEAYISKEFGRRMGAKEEETFFTGTGTDRPTGILSDTAGAEVGVTTNSTNSLNFDDLMDLFYSLRSPYRNKAVFIMNDATVKNIRKLKDGNGQYLWQPSVTAGTPDMILNRPVYTSSYMPTLGAGNKTVLFGDFSYFWIADRQGRVFKRLNELYATKNLVGFMTYQRVDAKLILPEAVKCLKQKA